MNWFITYRPALIAARLEANNGMCKWKCMAKILTIKLTAEQLYFCREHIQFKRIHSIPINNFEEDSKGLRSSNATS